MEQLSKAEARKLMLHSQRLLSFGKKGKAIDATQLAIEHLGYIQIDTISVIERAHHHVLWSRNPRYQSSHIDTLQQQRKIFEYWSHAAAYLPMKDYRYSLRKKKAIASGERHWYERDPVMMKKVLDRIKAEGPLQSKDFEDKSKSKREMWDWKPAKCALEQLFMEGVLMTTSRQNFQKVYDLTENVLPADVDTNEPTENEWIRYLISRFLQANGIGRAAEIAYLRKGLRPTVETVLQEMQEEGSVIELDVKGDRFFTLPESFELLKKPLSRQRARILSPFDNFIIQRKRIQQLFDFDYQIECYVPAAKRVYGYFCLPLLWDADLVGRIDCKADRKTETLLVQNLVIEKTIRKIDQFVDSLCKELALFMDFNGCKTVDVKSVSDAGIRKLLVDFFK